MAMSGRPLGSMIVELDMQSTKFEDSLKSIQNKFRLAKSEMKANLSVLDTTGTSYEKASSKVDSLSKMMSVNEEQISSLKSHYDTAVKTNGEYSDSAMKIANQLNKAEAQQAQYQRQLDNAKVAMKEATRETDSYREALNRVQRQVKVEVDSLTTQGRKTEANLVQYQALSKEINNYDKIISDEKNKLSELIETKGRDSKETQDQKAKVAELTATQEKAQYQYDELGKKVKNLSTNQAQSIDGMDRFSSKCHSVGSSIRGVGTKMTLGFTTPVVAGLGYATKSATDFSSEIANLEPLLKGNGESVKRVRKEITAMADDSKKWAIQYGISTKSVNNGMAELVRRGYSAEQTMGAMPSILDATKASGDDFNDVMDASTSTVEQFGLKSESTMGMLKNTQRVVDTLTYTANQTSAGFNDMGEALHYVGPMAHASGISLEETASAIGLMSNQGITGSLAGTALAASLKRMLNPSKQNREGFKQLGVNIDDFKNGTMGLPDMLDKINKHTKTWTDRQREASATLAFGSTAEKAMTGLIMQGGDALTDLTKKTEAAKGSTKKIADTMNNTAAANGAKFKESLHVLAITMGTELLPLVTPLIKKITSLIQSFSKMDKGTRKTIVTAALVAAAIGPIIMVLGQLITVIGGIAKGISFLVANPIVLVIAAIVAIGVGIYEAYKHIKPFHDAVNNLFNALKKFFTSIGKWFSELPGKIKAGFKSFSNWLGQIPKKIKSAFSGITSWGNQLASGLKKSWGGVTKTTSKWVSDFAKIGQKMLKAIIGAFKGFGKFLVYALALPVGIAVLIAKPLVQPLKNIMKALISDIKTIWLPYRNWLISFWKVISNAWKITITAISTWFHSIFTALGTWFKSIMSSISNIWHSVWTNISNFFKPILSSIGNFFRSTFNGIRNFFSSVMNAISNIASSVMDGISSAWHASLNAISSFFKSIFNGIKNFIGPIMSSISNFISSALSTISSTWSKMWQGMASFFGGIWKGIKDAAADGINGVIGVINSGVDAIDSVWKFFTGKKTSVPHLGKVHFEQGGVVEQHLSVINDGKGANWKELVQLPSGQIMMSHQRNWTGLLPAGTRIYNGDETKGIMNAVGIQHYAKGGIIGKIEGTGSGLINWAKGSLENVGSWIGNKFEALSKFMEHPIENTKALMTSAGNKLMPKISTYAEFAKGALDKTASKAGDWVKDHIQGVMDKMMESMGGSGGAMPAKAYGPMIRAAAAYMHQSITDFNVDMIERIIGNESGGNPRAINLTDKNAQMGTPSKGILQYIDPTFRNYAMPGFTDIWNPLHQLIALFNDATWRSDMGMGYNGKYGEWRGAASGPSGPRLMAMGGLITKATNAIIGEAGPELVLPLTNKTRAMQILSAAQAKFGNGASTSVSVDTTQIEENQKQQTLYMQIQNKILTKILEILTTGNGGSNDQNSLNKLYQMMDQLGLKDRKITKYQLG